MLTNTAKQKLQAGKIALGASASIGSQASAEQLALAGFDWINIDNQHGSWDRQSSSLAFMAVRAGGSIPMTRVPQNDFYAIARLLDEGALGIIVPMVEDAEDAERVAFAARYPPAGGRSVGFSGAAAYGDDYVDRFNDEVLVAIQLESGNAIANADEIMAVEGIDACWLGPGDLALSIGHERNSPQHDEAVRKMIAACQRHGKAPGIAAGSPEQIEKWANEGCTFVSVRGDRAYVADGAAADLAAVKALLD